MYRIFGSPYNLSFHQSVAYLRHKRAPFKVHNGSLTTTKLLSVWHRAKMSFCTLSPKRETLLLIHQVIERCEAEAATASGAAATAKAAAAAGASSSSAESAAASAVPLLINNEAYPKLALTSWALFLYLSSWLGSTGSLYRWVHGNGSNVVDDYVAYLSRATSIIPGAGALVGPRIRNLMVSTLAEIGIVREAEPYMIEHFNRLCEALEAHFVAIGGPAEAAAAAAEGAEAGGATVSSAASSSAVNMTASPYILGTSHPTLADVAMAAAFDGYFLRDDPPALDFITRYPALNRYLGLVSELGAANAADLLKQRGVVGTTTDADGSSTSATSIAFMNPITSAGSNGVPLSAASTAEPIVPGAGGCDTVFETLQPVLDLATEIFPWQIAQCDALRQFVSKGMAHEKTSVVDVASELPLLLWGRSGVVGDARDASSSSPSSSSSPAPPSALIPAGSLGGKVSAKVVTPKLKAAPYIMVIDRSIIPAHARCQEVELAQACALGAIGAYPLAVRASSSSSADSNNKRQLVSCSGCSDAYLASLQQSSGPSEALFALAGRLLAEADTIAAADVDAGADGAAVKASSSVVKDIPLFDFDTHHLRSSEASNAAGGGDTTTTQMQNVKNRARLAGRREQRHEYDVKKARAIAGEKEKKEASSATTATAAAEGVAEGTEKGSSAGNGDSVEVSGTPQRVESDTLAQPSASVPFALARIAMLLGRMYISEFELRSVYRSRGIEFAVIPRK